jgi:hypothetical protein
LEACLLSRQPSAARRYSAATGDATLLTEIGVFVATSARLLALIRPLSWVSHFSLSLPGRGASQESERPSFRAKSR